MCASDDKILAMKSSGLAPCSELEIAPYRKGFAGVARLASRLGVAPGDDGVIVISDEDGVMYPLIPLLHAFLDKMEVHDE